MGDNQRRAVWGITGALALLYVVGYFLGWASAHASWHLLLVIVAILILYSLLSTGGR